MGFRGFRRGFRRSRFRRWGVVNNTTRGICIAALVVLLTHHLWLILLSGIIEAFFLNEVF
jgi:hypothetical protein